MWTRTCIEKRVKADKVQRKVWRMFDIYNSLWNRYWKPLPLHYYLVRRHCKPVSKGLSNNLDKLTTDPDYDEISHNCHLMLINVLFWVSFVVAFDKWHLSRNIAWNSSLMVSFQLKIKKTKEGTTKRIKPHNNNNNLANHFPLTHILQVVS